jgi:hypothetical protein
MTAALPGILAFAIKEGPTMINIFKSIVNLIKGSVQKAEVANPLAGSGALKKAQVLQEVHAGIELLKATFPDLAAKIPNLDEIDKMIEQMAITLYGDKRDTVESIVKPGTMVPLDNGTLVLTFKSGYLSKVERS